TVVAILQARMGSTRLPGKVLKEILGRSIVGLIAERLAPSRRMDQLVVAMPDHPRDDALEAHCSAAGLACFRGSEEDLLDRYYQAARQHRADLVVRLTADNPLVEHEVLDFMIQDFLEAVPRYDYSGPADGSAWPLGVAAEVFTFEALERAWREDRDPAWREHATPYIYGHPELFRIRWVPCPRDATGVRLTVDTPEDLELVRRVFEHVGRPVFPWTEALDVLEAHPEWRELNRDVRQKTVPGL
ncbi:MAG: glycosyltransferase family protein, partial [Deltaproteobacteria bacterium]|nr:glycosyltransferase family protein [Deltaproteobacteria bacterium]